MQFIAFKMSQVQPGTTVIARNLILDQTNPQSGLRIIIYATRSEDKKYLERIFSRILDFSRLSKNPVVHKTTPVK